MKNRSTHLVSIFMIAIFAFLAYATSPDSSSRRNRKKKVITEQTIMNDPNLSDAEKAKMIADRKAKMDKERETKTVLAYDLSEAYDNNEVSADAKYKNKIFYVDGVIENIGKDILDNIYVTLEGVDILTSVTCYINDVEGVSALLKGMRIVIRGRCDGTLLGVSMEECEIVEILETADDSSLIDDDESF